MATRNPSLNLFGAQSRANGAEMPDSEAELNGARGAWWWTGKAPEECPGFCPEDRALRSLPLPPTRGFTRQQLLDNFDNCWTQTEILFAALQGTDAFIRQPYHQLRHPMMFYYGHPAVLYVNKFRVAGLLDEGIDPFIEQVFETGVDEMSWDDLSRARTDWPSVRTVHAYRIKSYKLIRSVIENHPSLDCEEVGMDTPAWAVFMGFEHERIHIETSSVLIRELPLCCVRKPEFWPDYHPSSQLPSPAIPSEGVDFPVNELVGVPGEKVVLGKRTDYPSFGWDNEYGVKEIDVSGFKASKFKVTNGEFLRFVRAGGYSNPKYWSTEGWGWKTFRNVKWPTFWIVDGPQGLHRYKLRALFDAIDMRWDWPVDVNYHEAKAFCAWKTELEGQQVAYRVISEAEHQLLRNTSDRSDAGRFIGAGGEGNANGPLRGAGAKAKASAGVADKEIDALINVDPAMHCGGADAASTFGFNFQLAHSSQNPVTELPPSSKGFHDVFGSAWEWAEDHYAAFPGFKVHPFYEDFSTPCFAGKHQLILGGSFISTGQLASKYARYQFRPHFFQHATFRCVLQAVDTTKYDMVRYGTHAPLKPFYETSCMDCAPPYVGDGPCCSVHRRAAFTPTMEEEAVSSQAKRDATQVLYESDTLMAQYLSLHYGPTDKVYHPEVLAAGGLLQAATEFPQRAADELASWARRCTEQQQQAPATPLGRALDLGCAVGRSSFALAAHFSEVVGIDISARFIEVAHKLKENGRMDYDLKVEGDITERVTAAVDGLGVDASRVRFVQGDACELPASFQGSYDAVLASNVLDRVPDPQRLLSAAAAALRPGGVLLLNSPFSWSNKYTASSNWIGGTYKDGQAQRSADALSAVLSQHFDVLAESTTPLLIPEHARKFELILAHQLVLRKK